jgi:endoglycosylceramidase
VRLALLLLLIGGCSEETPRWHVANGFLRAPDGRAVILRGANFTGAQKQKPYLDNPDTLPVLAKSFGFNAIRFVMTWAAVEPDRGRYDDAYLDGVAASVKAAGDAGLWVILDMHEDIYGEGFGFDGAPRWTCDESHYAAFVPRDPWFLNSLDDNVVACVDGFWKSDDLRAHFVSAWAHVAEWLRGERSVIGFDILNEPAWGSYSIFDFEPDLLAPLYGRVVSAVRAQAPDWVAFVEPSASRNAGIATSLPRPGYRDVVYSPHSYDSAAEGSGMFDPSRASAIADLGQKLAAEATALGAALTVGEYGGQPDGGGYAEYMDAEYAAQGTSAAGGLYWDASRGGGYSLFDTDGTPHPAALAAIARPYPAVIAGDPISYSFEGGHFRFSYVARSGATEIKVPFTVTHVDCGGCASELTATGVSVHGSGPITVDID